MDDFLRPPIEQAERGLLIGSESIRAHASLRAEDIGE